MHDHLHLCPREHLLLLTVTLGGERFPQAARRMQLFAEEAQGAVVVSVGVVELGQLGIANKLNKSLAILSVHPQELEPVS